MRRHRSVPCLAALACAVLLAAAPGRAEEAFDFEGDYDPTRTYLPNAPLGPSTWWDLALLRGGGRGPEVVFAAAIRADREYIDGMRRHHQGAVTMAQEYLAAPAARSPLLMRLARAIIANQRYEIALMEDVERRLAEPVRVLDLGLLRLAARPMATENLGQAWGVQRVPVPGLLDPAAPMGERDVQFAKGMIAHHRAALDMARRYNADAAARNGFLKILNVGIIADQGQEIALMRGAMAAFPGDSAAVQVPPGMVRGMPGMEHGGPHGDHGGGR